MFGDLALPTDDPVLFTPGLALLDTGSTNLLMPGDVSLELETDRVPKTDSIVATQQDLPEDEFGQGQL